MPHVNDSGIKYHFSGLLQNLNIEIPLKIQTKSPALERQLKVLHRQFEDQTPSNRILLHLQIQRQIQK